VGGSTGVGKTSIAVEVASRLEIAHVIGTDSIRQIMRLMFSDELMPEIHCSTYDAFEILSSENTGLRDPVIAGFLEQAQKIAVGVHALLDRALEENINMLIEGVNLLPGVLDLDRYRDRAHVIFVIAATLDVDDYRSRFVSRGSKVRDRAASRYLEHLREILTIQDHILAEADHYGLAIIDNVHFDAAVLSVIRSVLATLKKSLPATVQ
jgi:2-phosphoglycerate kinase